MADELKLDERIRTEVTLPGEQPEAANGAQEPSRVRIGIAPTDGSPFKPAGDTPKRLKMLVYGPSGTGKTTLGLSVPHPVVVDLEGGTDWYKERFDFSVMHAESADEVMQAVDWLRVNTHPYRTLVIDPITVFWESLQKQWSDVFLKRAQNSAGYRHEYFDLGPKEWGTIKGQLRQFNRHLFSLDMNVLLTAREKPLYKEGAFMQAAGVTFDAERGLPYLVDVIVRMYRNSEGKFLAKAMKDRTGRLPAGEFEMNFELLEQCFGADTFVREAVPVTLANDDQKARIRERIEAFGMTDEQVTRRLAVYGAQTLDDLTHDNAEIILRKFDEAAARASSGETNDAVTKEDDHV